APAVVGEVLNSPGSPLDAGTRSLIEPRFGHDFSRVRVHSDARAAESAEAVGAAAYTVGRDIAFGPGRYAPGTAEGRRLLAHELTHVLQQAGGLGGVASEREAEREADANGLAVEAGRGGRAGSASPAGLIQREEKKPEVKVSGERSGEKGEKEEPAVQDQFALKADVTLPVSGVSFGAVSFLDNLKLTPSYTAKGPMLGLFPATSDEFKLKLAMELLKLEIANVKKKEDALRKGKLSLGATLSPTGVVTLPFDPAKPLSSLGASVELKAGATTPTLIPSAYGTFTLGSTFSATGSATQTFAPDKTTPKAEGKTGVSLDYKSPASAHPLMTAGGLLGDKARVTAGIESTASGSLTPDKQSGAVTVGGSLGLTGERKGVETFVKLQVTGTFSADRKTGQAWANTSSVFVGLVGGFEFSLPGESKPKRKYK
ncbi:MAG TPA: DUF4157 domain-containing protein, partial [Pyrinomonadaceae bacterium]|nr:DUF4157 domain-containing protein [Pyrinomonadaceae bacterium]